MGQYFPGTCPELLHRLTFDQSGEVLGDAGGFPRLIRRMRGLWDADIASFAPYCFLCARVYAG